MNARYKTPKFFFGGWLTAVLALIPAFGPPALLARWMGPQTFWEHFAAAIVCGIIAIFTSGASFFLWLVIASRFE